MTLTAQICVYTCLYPDYDIILSKITFENDPRKKVRVIISTHSFSDTTNNYRNFSMSSIFWGHSYYFHWWRDTARPCKDRSFTEIWHTQWMLRTLDRTVANLYLLSDHVFLSLKENVCVRSSSAGTQRLRCATSHDWWPVLNPATIPHMDKTFLWWSCDNSRSKQTKTLRFSLDSSLQCE